MLPLSYPILSYPIPSHRPSPPCLPYLTLLEQDVLVGQTQRLLQRLHPHRSLLGPLLGIGLPVRGGPQQPLGRIHLQHSTARHSAAAAMKAASDSTAQGNPPPPAESPGWHPGLAAPAAAP